MRAARLTADPGVHPGNGCGHLDVQGIMAFVTVMSSARVLALFVASGVVCAVVLFWLQATSGPRSEVVGDSPSAEGWKTIEYGGVTIEIPSAWERLDMSDCEFQSERWAEPDSPPCDFEGGAAFYGSATLDPANGPGVRRTTENGIATWGGYVYSGDFAVYASDSDRDLVQAVLDSAQVTE